MLSRYLLGNYDLPKSEKLVWAIKHSVEIQFITSTAISIAVPAFVGAPLAPIAALYAMDFAQKYIQYGFVNRYSKLARENIETLTKVYKSHVDLLQLNFDKEHEFALKVQNFIESNPNSRESYLLKKYFAGEIHFFANKDNNIAQGPSDNSLIVKLANHTSVFEKLLAQNDILSAFDIENCKTLEKTQNLVKEHQNTISKMESITTAITVASALITFLPMYSKCLKALPNSILDHYRVHGVRLSITQLSLPVGMFPISWAFLGIGTLLVASKSFNEMSVDSAAKMVTGYREPAPEGSDLSDGENVFGALKNVAFKALATTALGALLTKADLYPKLAKLPFADKVIDMSAVNMVTVSR